MVIFFAVGAGGEPDEGEAVALGQAVNRLLDDGSFSGFQGDRFRFGNEGESEEAQADEADAHAERGREELFKGRL